MRGPSTVSIAIPVTASPAPTTADPRAWSHPSVRTTRPGSGGTNPGSTDRLRRVNGSSRLGTKRAIASDTWAARISGKSGARSGIRVVERSAARRRGRPSRPRHRAEGRAGPRPRRPTRTAVSRSMKIPDASSRPPGRSSAARSSARRMRTEAIRLAATRSNGPAPEGSEPGHARRRRATRLRRAFASVASIAIGSVSTPTSRVAPSSPAAMARTPDPQPTSRNRTGPAATGEPCSARGPGAVRRGAAEQPLVGPALDPREAEPRRGMEPRPEGHPGIHRDHDVARPAGGGAARWAGSRSDARSAAPRRGASTPWPSPPRGRPASAAPRSRAARRPGGGRAPDPPRRRRAGRRPRRARAGRPGPSPAPTGRRRRPAPRRRA